MILRLIFVLCLLLVYPCIGKSNANEEELSTEIISITNAVNLVEVYLIETEEMSEVYDANFNYDNSLIAYSTSSSLNVFNVVAQNLVWTIQVESGANVEFSPDGTQLAAESNYALSLWDIESDEDPIILSTPTQREIRRVSDIAFATNRNELIAVFSQAGALRRWNATTGEYISENTFGFDELSHVTHSILSSDGTLNVIARVDSVIELRNTIRGDVRNRIQTNELVAPDARLIPLAISYDNETVILSAEYLDISQPSQIILLQSNGEIGYSAEHTYGMVWTATLSPNDELLALGSRQTGEIYIWDTQTGEELVILSGHTEWVTSLTFNTTGTLLMSTSTDGTVRLWGVPAGE